MAVVQNEDTGKFDFSCDVPRCGFTSSEWPEEFQATARQEQHYNEHVTGEPCVELIEFEASVGFVREDYAAPTTPTGVTVNGVEFFFDAAGNLIEEPVAEEQVISEQSVGSLDELVVTDAPVQEG